MPNNCSLPPGGWSSINVQSLALPPGLPPPASQWAAPPVTAWRSCDDHSKWGLALPPGGGGLAGGSTTDVPGSAWVCFADNNREFSQATRGGAATCTESAALWRAMAATVQSAPDTCAGGAPAPAAGGPASSAEGAAVHVLGLLGPLAAVVLSALM